MIGLATATLDAANAIAEAKLEAMRTANVRVALARETFMIARRLAGNTPPQRARAASARVERAFEAWEQAHAAAEAARDEAAVAIARAQRAAGGVQ